MDLQDIDDEDEEDSEADEETEVPSSRGTSPFRSLHADPLSTNADLRSFTSFFNTLLQS
jgi:hypothetical protein